MSGKARIGFIGLGIMGAPMAQRLLDQGYELTGWNREPERLDLIVEQGGKRAQNPAEVRAASDIIILCVLDGDAVEQCCFGKEGLAASADGAALLIDCSTINPDRTRTLADRLQQQAGMDWVDAPISGGPGPAREGKLTVLAGGSDGSFAKARPVLEALAANLTHFGPLGAGQTAKIVNQAVVGVNYVLMAEILVLAEQAGIDAAVLPDAFAGGAADSRILQTIFRQMQKGDYANPKAYARQLDKDLKNLGLFADALELNLPLTKAAIDRFGEYVAAGNDMSDSAAIGRFYQQQIVPRP